MATNFKNTTLDDLPKSQVGTVGAFGGNLELGFGNEIVAGVATFLPLIHDYLHSTNYCSKYRPGMHPSKNAYKLAWTMISIVAALRHTMSGSHFHLW